MDCHSLLQGIFPIQGLNPGLLHYKQILYPLNHQGSMRLGNQSESSLFCRWLVVGGGYDVSQIWVLGLATHPTFYSVCFPVKWGSRREELFCLCLSTGSQVLVSLHWKGMQMMILFWSHLNMHIEIWQHLSLLSEWVYFYVLLLIMQQNC